MPVSPSEKNCPPPFTGELSRSDGGGKPRALFATIVLGLILSTTAASAGWQDQASDFDKHRLASLAEARLKGIGEARSGAGSGDASAIDSALGAQGHAPSAGEIVGGWRCRMIKLGGVSPYIVYSWFGCRISNRGGALFFEKLSGSQRTAGFLYPGEGGLVYLGGSSVVGEPPHAYSGNGASAGAGATPDDQIGLLTALGPGHARLELPYPVQESTFDVIELRR